MLIVSSALPQELGYWFCSQNLWLSSLLEWLPHEQQGLDLHLNLNSVSWPTMEQIIVNFYLFWNTWTNSDCVEFGFLLRLLTMLKLSQAVCLSQPSPRAPRMQCTIIWSEAGASTNNSFIDPNKCIVHRGEVQALRQRTQRSSACEGSWGNVLDGGICNRGSVFAPNRQ